MLSMRLLHPALLKHREELISNGLFGFVSAAKMVLFAEGEGVGALLSTHKATAQTSLREPGLLVIIGACF